MTRRTIDLSDFDRTAINIISAAHHISGQEFILSAVRAAVESCLERDAMLRKSVHYSTSVYLLNREADDSATMPFPVPSESAQTA